MNPVASIVHIEPDHLNNSFSSKEEEETKLKALKASSTNIVSSMEYPHTPRLLIRE